MTCFPSILTGSWGGRVGFWNDPGNGSFYETDGLLKEQTVLLICQYASAGNELKRREAPVGYRLASLPKKVAPSPAAYPALVAVAETA